MLILRSGLVFVHVGGRVWADDRTWCDWPMFASGDLAGIVWQSEPVRWERNIELARKGLL